MGNADGGILERRSEPLLVLANTGFGEIAAYAFEIVVRPGKDISVFGHPGRHGLELG